MKFTKQEVETRLEAAQRAGMIAALICVSAPVAYFVLLYLFRSQVAEAVRFIDRYTFGYTVTVWFLIAVATTPVILLPKLYAFLCNVVASFAHLVCPECGALISSGRDWKICLFTSKCPHCGQMIVSKTKTSEQKTKRIERHRTTNSAVPSEGAPSDVQ
jgi:predicted RNA-binding Zn-ribbon protein involved in translation (DUF1610 family)